MSEPTAAADDSVESTEQTAPEGQEQDEQLGETGKRALERERADRKKAAAERDELAERLKAIEDANKSEAQKQTEELERLRKAVADHEAQSQRAAWAAEVATETGVPADVLRGSSLEELQAHAAVIKPLITAETGPRVPNPGATPQRRSVSDEAAFAAELFGPK